MQKSGVNSYCPITAPTIKYSNCVAIIKGLRHKSSIRLCCFFNIFLNPNLSNTQHGMQLPSWAGRVKLLIGSYPGKQPFCAPPFPPHSSQGEATTRMCNSPSPCSSQPVRRRGGKSSQAAVFTTSRQHNHNGGLTRRLPRIHSQFLQKYLKHIY